MNYKLQQLAAAAALGLASLSTQAALIDIDVTGVQSFDLIGDAGNTVLFFNIGAGKVLNSLSWQVSLLARDPSFLSEIQVSFGDSSGLNQGSAAPALADGFSGTGSYSGQVDLAPLALAVGADGLLRIEFHEQFKDLAPGVADAQWTSGKLTFDVAAAPVPEPASAALLLLGLGLVGAQLRRATSRPSPAPSGS